jgi:pyrophosphatase PpaX
MQAGQNPIFRSALFDVDGTLVDTIPMIVAGLGDAFEHFTGNRPSQDALAELIGLPLSTQMNMFGLESRTEDSLDDRIRFTMDRYEAHSDLVRLFDEAITGFERMIEMGIPTGLVTSRNREELAWICDRFPVLRKAQVAISASDVMLPKPNPDPVLLALERLGAKAPETVFIGDSVHDVMAGQDAGCWTAAVAYGSGTYSGLAHEKPDFLFLTPAELNAWLDPQNFSTQQCELQKATPT